MPSLSIQNSQIEETLRSSLNQGRPEQSLAEILVSQSRTVLLKKIAFVEAQVASCAHHDKVKAKYVRMTEQSEKKYQATVMNGEHKKNIEGDGLPAPKVVLYSAEKLSLGWKQPVRLGTGLSNLGNTCFCNATLQCLIYTPPLFYYLVSKAHLSECRLHNFCMLCVMEEVVRNVLNKTGGVYQPLPVVRSFKAISKHFTLGRQEDAHEFLRYVIDNMNKSLLFGKPKLDSFSKNTTAVHQIFSGYLRSQVRCKNCDFRSNTYDPFFDIALDIKEAPNVYRALEHFTKGEFLSGENSYLCEKCKRRVPAMKRFSIHKVPNILTLQLKRFDAVRLTKINREVHFPSSLNVRSFMSVKQGDPVQFQLYGVLVHQGFSTSSGHYYSFVKSPSGQWLKMDDNRVHKVSLELVLRQNAYILFYNRVENVKKPLNQGPIIGPQLPQKYQQTQATNGPVSNPSNNTGTPVVRKLGAPTSTLSRPVPTVPAGNKAPPTKLTTSSLPGQPSAAPVTKSPNGPSASKVVGLDQRNKVSFGINLMKPRAVENKERTTESGKIVMKIKHGKVISNTASPPDKLTNGKKSPTSPISGNHGKLSPISAPGQNEVKRRLVPYLVDGDSSESDMEAVRVKGNGSPKRNSTEANSSPIVKKVESTGLTNGHSPVTGVNGKEAKKRRHSDSFEPVLDDKLKATTHVPGAYAPLDQEKFNGFKSPPAQKSLSVKVSSVDTKVNSTSKWTVFEQDQKSPSIASSNSSLNSTSDWHVNDMEGGMTKGEVTDGGGCSLANNGKKAFQNGSGQVGGSPVQKKSTSSRSQTETEEVHKTKHSIKVDQKLNLTETLPPLPPEVSSAKCVTEDSSEFHPRKGDVGSGNERKSSEKKKIKTTDHNSEASMTLGNHPEHARNRENKKLAEVEISRNDEGRVVDSDTQPLIDPDHPVLSKHKKKKKKKHKEHRRSGDSKEEKMAVFEYSTDNELLGSSTKKKKKKHKKKKHQDREDEEKLLCDTETPPAKKPKVNSVQKTTSQDNHGGSSSSSGAGASTQFQWVERTKETIEKEHSGQHSNVPVHQWNHGVKDLKMSEQQDAKTTQQHKHHNGKNGWDGTRNHSDVLKELYKESLQGYGASVSSWEGGKSTIDQEVIHERRKEKKRNWDDDYEDELDRGKMRKVTKHKEERFSGKTNFFQKFQENNTKDSQARNLFDTFSSNGKPAFSPQECRHNDFPPSTKPYHNGSNGWGGNKSYHGNNGVKDWKSGHHSANHRYTTHKH